MRAPYLVQWWMGYNFGEGTNSAAKRPDRYENARIPQRNANKRSGVRSCTRANPRQNCRSCLRKTQPTMQDLTPGSSNSYRTSMPIARRRSCKRRASGSRVENTTPSSSSFANRKRIPPTKREVTCPTFSALVISSRGRTSVGKTRCKKPRGPSRISLFATSSRASGQERRSRAQRLC